jgi:hypothetical protein
VGSYPAYFARRLGQFVLVVFIGVNITFFITHATPIDPVEQTIAASTSFGSTSPEAIALMRQSLRELYGLQGGLPHQYLVFWRRMVLGDFGPSLSAFPTPVSVLIWRALPWTAGLLMFSTVLAWCLGNLLGGLAGYYRGSRLLRLAGVMAMGFHPIPYYIVAFVLLIVFGYLWPVLPISGGAQMNLPRGFDQQHRHGHRDDRHRGDTQYQTVVTGVHGIDQQGADTRIAEHLFGNDGAVEDSAERNGQAGHLRHERIAHHVGPQDALAINAAEFGVGDIVLGDDVGNQRAHAHEPAADPDQHQRQRRQDGVQQHTADEADIGDTTTASRDERQRDVS